MEYSRWAPRYDAIRAEFGFPFERERVAADALVRLLPEESRTPPLPRIRPRLAGRDVVVVGAAPGTGPPPVWRLPSTDPAPALVAADGGAAACLAGRLVPTVVVTDLDGPVPSEVSANRQGALVVVHAHGDNRPALEAWVPEFPGELAGSWAGPPTEVLLDVGGFTDGDRAAYLAEACGARRVLLWGFDFERVEAPDAATRERKRAKFAWADRLLAELDREGGAPVVLWRRDGTLVDYPGGRNGASTR